MGQSHTLPIIPTAGSMGMLCSCCCHPMPLPRHRRRHRHRHRQNATIGCVRSKDCVLREISTYRATRSEMCESNPAYCMSCIWKGRREGGLRCDIGSTASDFRALCSAGSIVRWCGTCTGNFKTQNKVGPLLVSAADTKKESHLRMAMTDALRCWG